MKPSKFCKCIQCTDCEYYADCMKYEIETERTKGKSSFGKLKIGRFPVENYNLKD